MAGNIQFHPAPGLGDLMPGWFSVPQNPMTDGITYTPGIGEIMAGNYPVPQNPIKDYTNGQVSLLGQQPTKGPGMINGQVANPPSGAGMGCGCGGSCGGCGGGMGDISSDFTTFTNDLTSGNIIQAIQDPVMGLPMWGWAALVVVFLSAGGSNSHVSRARRAARAY